MSVLSSTNRFLTSVSFHAEGAEEGEDLDAMRSSIDEITIKDELVCWRWETASLEDVEEVREGAMEVPNNVKVLRRISVTD